MTLFIFKLSELIEPDKVHLYCCIGQDRQIKMRGGISNIDCPRCESFSRAISGVVPQYHI